MANLNVNTWYIDSAGWTAVAAWAASPTAYTCGNLVRQLATPAVGNERVFVCAVAGTSGASEPSWTLTRYGPTTTGSATLYECTGNPAVNGDLTNALTWAQQHTSSIAVTVGLIIYDSATASLQVITTAGNLGSAAPTFSATAGTVTSETGAGTAKWTSLGAASGFQYWKAPHARLGNAFASTWGAAGNSFYMGSDHAETQSATNSVVSPGASNTRCSVYSVDQTKVLPPTGSTLKSGASISMNGNHELTMSGYAYCWGVTFSFSNVTGNSGFVNWSLEACAIVQTAANAVAVGTSVSAVASTVTWENTTFSSPGGGYIYVSAGRFEWKNTASAIGTAPTLLFAGDGSAQGLAIIEGVDFSAMGSGKTIVGAGTTNNPCGQFIFVNCAFNSAVTIAAATAMEGGQSVDYIISDSSGTNYNQGRIVYEGALTPSTAIVRTGGAVQGGTPISWAIVTTSGAAWTFPFRAPGTWIYNSTTGSNVTVTLYGIWFGSALPNNDQIWHDVEYMGSSGSPIASLGSGTKANGLASGVAWAADTSAWDSEATARLNSTVYAVGNIFSQSGSPGSLFIVTAIGSSPHQSAASPPAGYTSAADGAVITDGNLTVHAGYRFAMTVTLSAPQPQLAGYLHSYVKAALASTTFYIDPLIVL